MAKIVKYFMTAPSIWHHYFRKLIGKQENVKYYHVGMFFDENNIIEQQGKVMIRDINHVNKILNTNNRLCIVRRKNLLSSQKRKIKQIAENDLGKGYDWLSCLSKFVAWLTAIKYFAFIQLPQKEICINRVAHWHKSAFGDKFGSPSHHLLTTHSMYKYIVSHPEEYEIIYEGIPSDED